MSYPLEKELLSSHYAAYFEVAARDPAMNALKEVLGRTTSSVTDMCLHALVKKSKDKTECCFKDQ